MLSDLQLTHAAFKLWLEGEGEDNRADLEKLKRILPIILQECVTPKQREYITRYYIDKMNIKEIAELYGVNRTTVSRGIHRGIHNAYRYLRFVSPLFIKVPERRGYLKNGKNRRGSP